MAITQKEAADEALCNQIKITSTLALIAAFVSISTFARAGKQDFILHNETGVELHSVYVSPASMDELQENILGKDTLASGQSVKINFDDRDKHTHWDLKVTDKDGNSLEWYDLNLIMVKELTLRYDAQKRKAWADIK